MPNYAPFWLCIALEVLPESCHLKFSKAGVVSSCKKLSHWGIHFGSCNYFKSQIQQVTLQQFFPWPKLLQLHVEIELYKDKIGKQNGAGGVEVWGSNKCVW